jgi:hypothetical protein
MFGYFEDASKLLQQHFAMLILCFHHGGTKVLRQVPS